MQKNVCVCLKTSLAYLSSRFSVIQTVKLVESADVEAIPEGIMHVDFAVEERSTTRG